MTGPNPQHDVKLAPKKSQPVVDTQPAKAKKENFTNVVAISGLGTGAAFNDKANAEPLATGSPEKRPTGAKAGTKKPKKKATKLPKFGDIDPGRDLAQYAAKWGYSLEPGQLELAQAGLKSKESFDFLNDLSDAARKLVTIDNIEAANFDTQQFLATLTPGDRTELKSQMSASAYKEAVNSVENYRFVRSISSELRTLLGPQSIKNQTTPLPEQTLKLHLNHKEFGVTKLSLPEREVLAERWAYEIGEKRFAEATASQASYVFVDALAEIERRVVGVNEIRAAKELSAIRWAELRQMDLEAMTSEDKAAVKAKWITEGLQENDYRVAAAMNDPYLYKYFCRLNDKQRKWVTMEQFLARSHPSKDQIEAAEHSAIMSESSTQLRQREKEAADYRERRAQQKLEEVNKLYESAMKNYPCLNNKEATLNRIRAEVLANQLFGPEDFSRLVEEKWNSQRSPTDQATWVKWMGLELREHDRYETLPARNVTRLVYSKPAEPVTAQTIAASTTTDTIAIVSHISLSLDSFIPPTVKTNTTADDLLNQLFSNIARNNRLHVTLETRRHVHLPHRYWTPLRGLNTIPSGNRGVGGDYDRYHSEPGSEVMLPRWVRTAGPYPRYDHDEAAIELALDWAYEAMVVRLRQRATNVLNQDGLPQ